MLQKQYGFLRITIRIPTYCQIRGEYALPAAKYQHFGGLYFVAKTQRTRKAAARRCEDPDNNCLNRIAAEQVFMSRQMLLIEIDDSWLENRPVPVLLAN